MATTSASEPSSTFSIQGTVQDVLSAWIDVSKNKHNAETLERLTRAETEQQLLMRTPEVQYQNRGGSFDVRSEPTRPVQFVLPPWALWAGGIAAAVGVGAVVVKLTK